MPLYSSISYDTKTALDRAMQRKSDRLENQDPYALFHELRNPFLKAAEQKKAGLIAHERLDEGVRLVALSMELNQDASPATILQGLQEHSDRQLWNNESKYDVSLQTIIAGDNTDDSVSKAILVTLRYNEHPLCARKLCESRLSSEELAVIGNNDDHFINHAARLSFQDYLQEFKYRDSIKNTTLTDFVTVKQLIKAQSETSLGPETSAYPMLTA